MCITDLVYIFTRFVQPTFESLYGNRLSYANQSTFKLSCREYCQFRKVNNRWATLSELFNVTYDPPTRNFTYMDMVMDVPQGDLYIIAEAVNLTDLGPMRVTFEVQQGALLDMAGNPCDGKYH